MGHIMDIRSQIPFASNNDDGVLHDVGLAGFTHYPAARESALTKLGPLMFASAQLGKRSELCTWQLAGDAYRSVWQVAATVLCHPLPMETGYYLLTAHGVCDSGMDPHMVSLRS